jgi:hypothetical protein
MDEYNQQLETLFGNAECNISQFGFETTVSVSFKIDVKEWNRLRKARQLGSLYNTDLSNYLSRKGVLRFYAVPSVDDRRRAKDGVKTIHVSFTKRAA